MLYYQISLLCYIIRPLHAILPDIVMLSGVAVLPDILYATFSNKGHQMSGKPFLNQIAHYNFVSKTVGVLEARGFWSIDQQTEVPVFGHGTKYHTVRLLLPHTRRLDAGERYVWRGDDPA